MTKFSDIRLMPEVVSHVMSRSDVTLKANIGSYALEMPVLASPMVDVCHSKVCNALTEFKGGMGFLHRFQSINEQALEYTLCLHAGAAIGVRDLDRFKALYEVGCRLFIIDCANGAHINVARTIDECLDEQDKDVEFIIGNVASAKTFEWCQDLDNVVGIRVGIGSGAACTTKDATGILTDPFPLLEDCADSARRGVSIIWDGGVQSVGDMCKALMYADLVMVGRIFAAATDSPAQTIRRDGEGKEYNFYKKYHGSASAFNQALYRENPGYIEGTGVLLESTETLYEIIVRIRQGIQSCCSYFNAHNLKEFRNNVLYEE